MQNTVGFYAATIKNRKFQDSVSFDARSGRMVPTCPDVLPIRLRWSNTAGIEISNIAANSRVV